MTCPYCKANTPGLEPCFPECEPEAIDAYEEDGAETMPEEPWRDRLDIMRDDEKDRRVQEGRE